MTFTSAETAACQRLVEMALDEDLNQEGDLTSQAIILKDSRGRAAFRARAPGVVAGLPAAELVFSAVDQTLQFESCTQDGGFVERGDAIARISGRMRGILAGERTALNFLQHLSGIATRTRQYVDQIAGARCCILDTRKTLPGWRLLEKYAVRCGGGRNHRMGLFDAVLIKDNHLAALDKSADSIARAVSAARQRLGASISLTIEVDTLDQLDAALHAKPEVILLDNMDEKQLKEAVRRRNAVAASVLLEASGRVTLSAVQAIAATGVDRISIGDLTHSAPALDLALDYETS